MAEVVLRPGTSADVPALRALGEAVVPPAYGPIDAAYGQRMLDEWWSLERLGAWLARIPHIVAEHDGEVVGVANLGPAGVRGEERAVMWKLYVHPAHHRAGVGSRLLGAVADLVEGDTLWLEHVEGNEPARAFYLAHGFEEVERVAAPPWPADIWLRKALG